jgi:hypothetical protein
MKALLFYTIILASTACFAQSEKVKFSAFDGHIIAGYVDNSAFINFTGPNVRYSIQESQFVLGLLPTLRFKQDNGETKNSFVTPSLGAGLTYSYKFYSIQVPVYYAPKSATKDGRWHVGVGAGLRISKLRKPKTTS